MLLDAVLEDDELIARRSPLYDDDDIDDEGYEDEDEDDLYDDEDEDWDEDDDWEEDEDYEDLDEEDEEY